jgi:NAD(P)-dependent dehydrogenase (short-subunit alcohol dehydrogenase family)
MKAQRIEGAVALVTGASRGIGLALTEALLARGVRKVYATARNPEALRALAFAILDGIEAGQEDIFPDPFAVDFGRQFGSSPKAAERQIAAMAAAMLSGAAA